MSVIGFLKCLTVMDLSLAMKDVSKITTQYEKWFSEAATFMRKHGITRAATAVSMRFKKSHWEFTEDLGDELGAALKAAMPSFVADTSITHEQLSLLKDLSLFMRKDSPAAWARVSKNVSSLGDHQLAAMFLSDDSKDVADLSIQQTMERIVLKLTGRKNDPIMSVNEVREFTVANPKVMAQYIALRKLFKQNYQTSLMKFVRLSGKQIVDVRQAASYLDAMGCNYLPVGFVGKVDEKGKLYTTAGKALKGTMFGRMSMNPNYDPKLDDTYYAKLIGDMRGELRTVDFLKRSKTQRIDSVANFAENIESHRKTWLKDLDSLDQAKQMIAAIIEIIHLTHARIGGEKNQNDGVQTFGISTIRGKHVRLTPQGLAMKYPGKKGTMQFHKISPTTPSNRKLISLMKKWLSTKTSADRVFVAGGKPILPSEVNGYLRRIGVKVTIHKFRHAAATATAMEMLSKSPFDKKHVPTQAQAERWIKTEAIKIGTMLHHRTGSGDAQKVTSSTAIAAYISPDLIKNFFVDLGLRVPKWVPEFEED